MHCDLVVECDLTHNYASSCMRVLYVCIDRRSMMCAYAYLEGRSKRFSTQWLPTHSEPKDKGSRRKLRTPKSRKFKILHRDALQKAVDF